MFCMHILRRSSDALRHRQGFHNFVYKCRVKKNLPPLNVHILSHYKHRINCILLRIYVIDEYKVVHTITWLVLGIMFSYNVLFSWPCFGRLVAITSQK